MLTHPLPHDILRVILLHYLAVAGDTIETISDPYSLFFAKQLSTLPTEKHDMFQYRWITLTTDGKYCITSHNKWHSSDAVRLWDIATKESIIIAKTHITPFNYLKKTNRVLCLESIHNNTARLYCYDIITHTKHTIYSIDIPLSEWWLNIKVDPQEQHCALLAHNFLIIANLTTMHTAECTLNHYSHKTLALN